MTPERWEQIGTIMDAALALDATKRSEYLEQACSGDAELRNEVESLLDSHHEAGSHFLSTGAAPELAPQDRTRTGVRIGPYLLQELIGRGGMGEVFAAIRADGQFKKRVALKLVRSGYGSDFVLERFRAERQILASLEHPNIAQLLDGGTTEDGVPYLVMELVEGVPIDTYCDQQYLSVTERLQLFRRVCNGVEYAHQHLVVHRDIKPSNIFVSKDGTPKLLDFGIAKIVGETGTVDATVDRPMTPEFASPEQVCGGPITTASDVYSLGVVLYRLLTCRSPYQTKTTSAHELTRAIAETEPDIPSMAAQKGPIESKAVPEGSQARLGRRLRGDLDAIVLKALRKKPAHRFGSVEQFSEDIRRHLEGLPVYARKGTWSYHSVKFVRRHSGAVIGAVLILTAILAGVIATVHEARIASANRERAERRFNDVRKLSNSLIFEVADALERLPGATKPRQIVLQRAVEYLDSLLKEAGNDQDLQRELAGAYSRIGALQGDPLSINIGDTKGALSSFQKSLALREALAKANPTSHRDQVALANGYLDYGEFEAGAVRDVPEGFEYIKKAVAIVDREAPNSRDMRTVAIATRAYSDLGFFEIGNGLAGTVGTLDDGVVSMQKALEYDRRGIEIAPSAPDFAGQLLTIEMMLGAAKVQLGDRTTAMQIYTRALSSMQSLNSKKESTILDYNISGVESRIGDIYLMESNSGEAAKWFRRCIDQVEPLIAKDPASPSWKKQLVAGYGAFGHALIEERKLDEGLSYMRKAQRMLEELPADDLLVQVYKSVAYAWVGEAFERRGQLREALANYRQSEQILAAMRSSGTNDARVQVLHAESQVRLASTLLRIGDTDQAEKALRQFTELLESRHSAKPDDTETIYALAEAYAQLGNAAANSARKAATIQDGAAQWATAKGWYEKSLSAWNRIKNPARMNISYLEVTTPTEILRRLAECKSHLHS